MIRHKKKGDFSATEFLKYTHFFDAKGNPVDIKAIPQEEVDDWKEEAGLLEDVAGMEVEATGEEFNRLANPTAFKHQQKQE